MTDFPTPATSLSASSDSGSRAARRRTDSSAFARWAAGHSGTAHNAVTRVRGHQLMVRCGAPRDHRDAGRMTPGELLLRGWQYAALPGAAPPAPRCAGAPRHAG